MSTAPEWTTLGSVQPGDQIAYFGWRPATKDEPADTWRTITAVERDGRFIIVTLDKGQPLEAGHQYRLWVRR